MRGKARLSAFCLLLLSLAELSQAGPVNRASQTLNSSDGSLEDPLELSTNSTAEGGCIFGIKRFVLGESVPSPKKCEDCLCTENGIQCTPIQCEVRSGCKALHRADHCCPLYQCECERNGVTYSNGEKLVDPENPCQVCYCQGGEIVCNQLACFRRDDCEPRYVPGRCCPEYDHCPPREKVSNTIVKVTSQKIEPQRITEMTTQSYSEDKIITENVKPFILDDDSKLQSSGDSLEDNVPSKPIVISLNGSQNTNKVIPTLNIKEVTGTLNNEIRIKEILPVNSYDFSTTDPSKSPTNVREASYVKEADSNIKNDTEAENVEVYQTPPILRIGDQLLFLNRGDLVPNNSSVNTPAPVFTVIGAEGLQRVIEDPEETFEGKDIKDEDPNEIKNEENINNIKDDSSNTTRNSAVSSEYIEYEAKKSVQTSTEDPEQIYKEIVSELYETTTMGYDEGFTENIKYRDSLLSNDIKRVFISELSSTESDSSSEGNLIDDSTTVEPQKNVNQILEEEQHSIPIEHLPEHNPEYPPIPEDIMILSMTEDSLESGSSEVEYSGSSSIAAHESKNKEEISLLKMAPTFNPDLVNESTMLKNSEKIIPEILELVRPNKTKVTSNSSSFVPEDWLKNKEQAENKLNNVDIPLINLDAQLPDSILLAPSYKDSKEEDDSNDFIFMNPNATPTERRSDIFTTESSAGFTEDEELQSELRSPGEPFLIPEWERNTTTDINDDLYTTITSILINDSEEADLDAQTTENVIENSDKPKKSYKSEDDDGITEDPIINLIISTEYASIQESSSVKKDASENEKVRLDGESSDNTPTKKQKKTGIESNKMGNILADLISLVGDVASMGNHETELSTVHNSIEPEKYTAATAKEVQPIKETTVSNVIMTSANTPMTTIVELSEFSTEGNLEDVPLENEKVEFTTKKVYIDKDSDGKKNWKSTEHIKKDIELIPKVENKVKNPSLEKIINNVTNQKASDDKVLKKDTNKNQTNVSLNTKTPKANRKTTTTTTTTPTPTTTTLAPTTTTTAPTTTTTTTTPAPTTTSTTMKNINLATNPPQSINEDVVKSLNIVTDSFENEDTTLTSDPTVMKVSTKSDLNIYESQNEDKLTKRETNSQLIDSSGQIDESLISILREFFEKQYRQ